MVRFLSFVAVVLAAVLLSHTMHIADAQVSPPAEQEEEPEACGRSLGGWQNAEDDAHSQASQACTAAGCTGYTVTGGNFYRDGVWYVWCITYECTGCGGGGGTPVGTTQ